MASASVPTLSLIHIFVEYRDIAALFQLFLNLKASRSSNVLQINAAKALGDQGNGVDDGIYIFGIRCV